MDNHTVEEAKKNKKMLDFLISSTELKEGVSKEILTLYPNVINAGFADSVNRDDETKLVLVIDVSDYLEDAELINMANWLKSRFNKDVSIKQVLVEMP